jgi:hypothetical protein
LSALRGGRGEGHDVSCSIEVFAGV